MTLDASSGSDAKLSGKVKTFEAEASSGSDIKAQDMESQICKVRASSGSDAMPSDPDICPMAISWEWSWMLVGKGQAPDGMCHQSYHITFNANCEPTVYIDSWRCECK